MQVSGMGVFSLDHEDGEEQHELDFAHAEAPAMYDRLTYLRSLRAVADKHEVTYMPKPDAGAWGSGTHMNMSIESLSGKNLFVTGAGDDRVGTQLVKQFAAGLLRHAPALAALTCPVPSRWVSTHQLSRSGPGRLRRDAAPGSAVIQMTAPEIIRTPATAHRQTSWRKTNATAGAVAPTSRMRQPAQSGSHCRRGPRGMVSTFALALVIPVLPPPGRLLGRTLPAPGKVARGRRSRPAGPRRHVSCPWRPRLGTERPGPGSAAAGFATAPGPDGRRSGRAG